VQHQRQALRARERALQFFQLFSPVEQPHLRELVWLFNRREQLKNLQRPLPSPQRLPLMLHPMRQLLRRTSLISILLHPTPGFS